MPPLSTALSKVINGDEATRIGMTLESVPRDEVLGRAQEHATRMAAASPNAVRGLVETLR